ncbi:hypothetical protein BTJ68_09727 [Hortaea werneckii EXF-2000]|uniref:Transcription factor domain-containing protein n=2 Tax=Hortaea werneckii TaxID=91943 RepID=A0A3M7J3U7_HORWE|nr:hypothetical protein BTJ68_09727 [Hortaea werneckii EXF-2000]RMZ32272.1 hypothetical protein D0859_03623 [Hortaea werneckii]
MCQTETLTASTQGRTAMNLIAELDDYCQQLESNQSLSCDYRAGPFGVFEAAGGIVMETEAPTGTFPESRAIQDSGAQEFAATGLEPTALNGADSLLADVPDCGIPPPHDHPSDSSVEEIEHGISRNQAWGHASFDSNELQLQLQNEFCRIDEPTISTFDWDLPLDFPNENFGRLDFSDLLRPVLPTENPGAPDTSDIDPLTSSSSARKTHSHWSHLLTKAPSLLRRCQTGGVESDPVKQSFWKSFALPSALRTFADLSVFDTASDISLSIFYSTLANGAFQMQREEDKNAGGSNWLTVASDAEEAAQYFLRSNCSSDAEPLDYQGHLTAQLSLSLASLHRRPEKTMLHLIEAERILRTRRASAAPITLQYRALSHVYTYFRIIMESIYFVTGQRSGSKQGDGSLGSFSVTEHNLGVGLDPDLEKTSDLGYNDIHLDVHGRWHETLYTNIYGVPESFLTLLSQTVKLANGKTNLEKAAANSLYVTDALRRHIKTLERNIWAFPSKGIGTEDTVTERPLISGVHHALTVYFYRHVHKLDAMLLQDSVRKAVDQLGPWLDHLECGSDLTLLVAWAAFVVTCEAATEPLQELALNCLTRAESCSAFFTVRKLSHIAPKVWERRKQSNDWTISWLDIVVED